MLEVAAVEVTGEAIGPLDYRQDRRHYPAAPARRGVPDVRGAEDYRLHPGPHRSQSRRAWGLHQPIADVVKLVLKEVIIPTGADRFLFLAAPILALAPALAAWAVVPFAAETVLADINAGLLYILALSSMGVYGIIIAG